MTASCAADESSIELRAHGNPAHRTLIYLPGLHGDWTLIASFRKVISERFHFVAITYPRTLAWSIHDYAREVLGSLRSAGLDGGWILAESFSSQVAWAMLELQQADPPRRTFQIDGLILAGGFVKYPNGLGLSFAQTLARVLPSHLSKVAFAFYALYARFRHRHAPESAAAVHEFIARRTPADIAAIRHRLALIQNYDPSPIARATTIRVYLLAGAIDPIVPIRRVRRWLQANCPGFRGHRTIFPADHTVLATEPSKSAEQIQRWLDDRE